MWEGRLQGILISIYYIVTEMPSAGIGNRTWQSWLEKWTEPVICKILQYQMILRTPFAVWNFSRALTRCGGHKRDQKLLGNCQQDSLQSTLHLSSWMQSICLFLLFIVFSLFGLNSCYRDSSSLTCLLLIFHINFGIIFGLSHPILCSSQEGSGIMWWSSHFYSQSKCG